MMYLMSLIGSVDVNSFFKNLVKGSGHLTFEGVEYPQVGRGARPAAWGAI
jgi:hypothetical protein